MEDKRFLSLRNAILFGGLIVLSTFLLLLGSILTAMIGTKRFFIYEQQSTTSLSYYDFINQSGIEASENRSVSRPNNAVNYPNQNRNSQKRDRRFIIFNGSGVVKLVLGASFPIKLADPVRSLSFFYNLQLQYTPIPRPIYWWSFYNTSSFPGLVRKAKKSMPEGIYRDISRDFIYSTIEAAFESTGLPGTQCLLSMICEISRQPFHIQRNMDDSESWGQRNLIHEVLNAIFSPTLLNIDAKYMQAYYNGLHGAICNYNCPKHKNWLEKRSIFI